MKVFKKIIVTMLVIAMVVSNIAGSVMKVNADTSVGIIFSEKVDDIKGVPGETVHVKLPIRATGGSLQEPRITVVTDDMPFTVKNIALTAPNFTEANPPISITSTSTCYIEFDLAVKETAKIGVKKLVINVDAIYFDYSSDDSSPKSGSFTLPSLNFIISEEKEPAQLTVDNVSYNSANIGGDTTIEFTIKNEGGIAARNAYFSIDNESLSAAGLIPNYTKLQQKIGDSGVLKAGASYQTSLSFKVSSSATEGAKSLTVNMNYKNEDGESFKDSSQIYITISKNENAPKIEIVSNKYASELKAGDKFNLVTTIKNVGGSTAKNIEVSVEGLGLTSFLPGYTSKTISAGTIAVDVKKDVKIPLIVSNEATVGLKEVPITITYQDKSGATFETKTTLYLNVETADGVDSSGKPNIIISNVRQNPEMPNGGGRVDVSFDMENKSKVDISDIKIAVVASGSNFSPLSSEPYIYIDSIKAGKKASITIPVMASETIPEGTNSLQLQYEYKDAKGATVSMADNSVTLYIQNVQNAGIGSSKPKLIISDFDTDSEELRAGNTFNFIFDIKNTHTNVDAQNIKVTITQADNIFSVVNGSNTFFIPKIKAGETVKNTIELKVKSDATTKAYPIEIAMEYDYVGAEANPTTGEIGETAKETINLQAVENTRPVVDNISVGSWETPTVNQPTILSFQFYNLGKSVLSNVQASVEGDFILNTGNMYYIGNVESGSQEFAELDVTPTVEGVAKGTLVVTFEDSNGETVTITKEFEGTIMGEYIPNMGDDMSAGEGVMEQAKSPILPIWLFIIIQLAIIGVFIPVTRKVVLTLYKRKLSKDEEIE